MLACLILTTFMFLSGDAQLSVDVKKPCNTCLGRVEMGDRNASINYLSKYGYFRGNDKYNYNIDENTYRWGIKMFQSFFDLPMERPGELDAATVDQMNQRRYNCDSPDIIDKIGIFPRRKKRFILQGSQWKRGNITYRITKYPSPSSTKMSNVEVDRELRKALDLWSEHANLNFIYKRRGRIHMNISFHRGSHGDDDPFDGCGGVHAHGFFPVYGGDTHFDDAEEWVRNNGNSSDGNKTPIDLPVTAAHEIGHALGLSHSRVRRSLMAPYYKDYTENLSLHKDDIRGIQKLYGPNPRSKVNKPNGEPQRCVTQDCDLCSNTKLDTIVNHQGSFFVFSGDFYWKLVPESTQLETGYPRSITEDWDGLPGDVDASYTWKTGKTFFLKGSKLWRFTNRKTDKGFPKEITDALPGIPNDVDAAFYWPATESVYFFKGFQYWVFNPKVRPRQKSSFPPRNISDLEGFPASIDAAIQFLNGRFYMFIERWYYRINKNEVSIDIDPTSKYPFPRMITERWFGCQDSTQIPEGNLGILERVHIYGLD